MNRRTVHLGFGFSTTAAAFLAGIALAQGALVFEVATVKLADPGKLANGAVLAPIVTGGIGSSNPEQINYKGIWLSTLVSAAYGVRGDLISGPDWMSDQRYDVVAKIPPGTTKEQFQVMMQNLLRQRFNISFHRETRKRDVYALIVGKNGSKLKPHVAVAADPDAPARAIGGADPQGFPMLPLSYVGIVGRPVAGQMFLAGQGITIRDIASSLESFTGRQIVDETGLTGTYDFKLAYERSLTRGTTGRAELGADIFAAVEEQLGLKMENKSAQVEFLVIDTLNRQPTEN